MKLKYGVSDVQFTLERRQKLQEATQQSQPIEPFKDFKTLNSLVALAMINGEPAYLEFTSDEMASYMVWFIQVCQREEFKVGYGLWKYKGLVIEVVEDETT